MDKKWTLAILLLISYSNGIDKIIGPSKTDKIAIVGAGPAGIHMAYLLKQKGFTNVTVFEATNRIGGKCYTFPHRGAPHELGYAYLYPDFEDNIIELANKFNYSNHVNVPVPSIWKDFNNSLDFKTYIILEVMQFLQTEDVVLVAKALATKMRSYIELHISLFGEYKGELMPRPSQGVLYLIKGTAKEFLERNNLALLTPLFHVSHTMQGYGKLHETPALYLLLWNTPKLMNSFIERFLGNERAGIYLLEAGVQGLWERIASKEGLNVLLNTRVRKVNRRGKGVLITYVNTRRPRSSRVTEKFDFVMWSPQLGSSLRIIGATDSETLLFSTAKSQFLTVTIVDEIGVRRSKSPIDYWLNNLINGDDYSVIAQRDSYSTLNEISGEEYKNGATKTGSDKSKWRTMVTYQIGTKRPRKGILRRKLRKHFRARLGATNLTVVKRKTWRYALGYDVEDIDDGILWDILEEQGRHKMFYIGSSVSFESQKSVMEYNKLLVDLMT